MFTAEQRAALTAKLGKPANAPDADILAALLADYDAQTADLTTAHGKAVAAEGQVTSLSAKVTALESERDTAKAEVLKLSGAAPREPDPMSLALITRAFKTEREQVIASGVISEAGMKEIDELLMPGGKPDGTALRLSAGSTDPLYIRMCDIIRHHPGVKTNNGVERGVAVPIPPMSAAADGYDMDEEIKAANAYRDAQLAARGHQVAGTAK